ncbi:MAG TPA: hypothetical protein VFS21_34850 [Roseiflexaceae bacterium]|nr:hypothetical protein [Roseiflexaceae bacterium]
MPLDLLPAVSFLGPALPEPFVRHELEQALAKHRLLPRATGAEGEALQRDWERYRRGLRDLVPASGPLRVRGHVLEPLLERLGYSRLEDGGAVETREGREDGGVLLVSVDGTARLRAWATAIEADLEAPAQRGSSHRYSHTASAGRVLLAARERLGLLTNGVELRLLISDPARRDSQIIIPIDPDWRRSPAAPDSFRLLLALASPAGLRALPELIDQARLQQTRVTRDLRLQARRAIEGFVQSILDHPDNRARLEDGRLSVAGGYDGALPPTPLSPAELWREGLVMIYRLLFVLNLEATGDPARAFSFASTSLWRNTFSPSVALAPYARRALDQRAETGHILEEGLRAVCRLFVEGVRSTELTVEPLGGALFDTAPLTIERLRWGEQGVASLLDNLLWTPAKNREGRQRVYYGALNVEELGRVYEALLELEPGIAAEPMCRLRRQKLEVVVPLAQGEKYRAAPAAPADEADPPEDEETAEEDETPARGKKTRVEWVEAIPAGRFFLRVGLGRKATGSYYTPDTFVRFLVQETLGPQCDERSTEDEPRPAALLKLRVLDPAMGSGHFLVGACRFLGVRLYEACRRCDELAGEAEARAAAARDPQERERHHARAQELRARLSALPDPSRSLEQYLPSRAVEGEGAGVSRAIAMALCRRLVAVHCLYGVDKNPLAVELAKLALWLEAHAEGCPLTFLDHRLVVGDSLTGPFVEHLQKLPGNQSALEGDLFSQGLLGRLRERLADALRAVADLEATAGVTQHELDEKQQARRRLDAALAPFRLLALAWSGGVMLGKQGCDDDAYLALARWAAGQPADDDTLPPALRRMLARGLGLRALPDAVRSYADALALLCEPGRVQLVPALPYDLAFPEVFYPHGQPGEQVGFHAVVGNPPWDAIQFKSKEFFAAFNFEVLDAPTQRERELIEMKISSDGRVDTLLKEQIQDFEQIKQINDVLYGYQKIKVENDLAGRQIDAFRVFMERNCQSLNINGYTGVIVPSAFHANEGATGIRKLYLENMSLVSCFSFENRKKIFDIHSSFKFAPVIAKKQGPSKDFKCAFYIHNDQWLFERQYQDNELLYSLEFLQKTGGKYLSFLELKDRASWKIIETFWKSKRVFRCISKDWRIRFRMTELHMSHDSRRFDEAKSLFGNIDLRKPQEHKRTITSGFAILHEGKTYHQYTDIWSESPRYLVDISSLVDRAYLIKSAEYYRVAFRAIASSTNERTIIAAILPSGVFCGHTSPIESSPQERPYHLSLLTLSIMNSFCFDFLARQKIQASVAAYILEDLPIPETENIGSFCCHLSLRLTCNHAGYAPLWREQVGEAWREERAPFDWPALAGDDARWAVRAAIDAVVADAYGLSREQYAHVLGSFSHKSYPRAPELCLAAYDELKALGLEAFARRHDPYHDIPLNENLPKPVIELPLPQGDPSAPPAGKARRSRRPTAPQMGLPLAGAGEAADSEQAATDAP